METAIFLLIFFSIAAVLFFIIARDKPKTRLLYSPAKSPQEPEGAVAKNIFRVKKGIFRLIDPLTKFLSEKIGVGEKTKRNLVSAGSPITSGEFLTIKFLIAIAVFIAVTFFSFARENIILIFLAVTFGWFIPDLWIKRKIKRRHREIMRDMPLVIDLLILCIDAGLDFMVAIERTIREYRQESVMVEELKELSREIKMGFTRAQALRNLSTRINMPELSSFARTLIQADKLGSPIGDALRVQAEDLRIRRFQKGEEMALKAPIKLLIPLLFCILPVVLIVVGGPIFLQFLKGGFSIGGM